MAIHYLKSAANQLSIPSNIIATESLDKAKEMSLSMALSYDSTGMSNAMRLLPASKIKEAEKVIQHYHELIIEDWKNFFILHKKVKSIKITKKLN